jgi:hypothetical protein
MKSRNLKTKKRIRRLKSKPKTTTIYLKRRNQDSPKKKKRKIKSLITTALRKRLKTLKISG